MADEVSDYVEIRGIKVREVKRTYTDPEGQEHMAVFVEDDKGRVLFAPEFLAHTNDYVKVEVIVALPGHPVDVYEVIDYDLNAHAMAAVLIPHRGGKVPKQEEDA